MRRPLALLIAATLALGVAAPASAQVKSKGKLVLANEQLPAMYPGETAWVNILWQAEDGAVSDVVVTASGKSDVEIAYPTPSRGYTSFTDGGSLGQGVIDFTGLKVTVPEDAQKKANLEVEVTYFNGEKAASTKAKIEIPILEPGDQPWLRRTPEVAVQAGQPAWVHVHFEGRMPNDGFRAVGSVPGAQLHYPSDRTATSLDGDAQLDPREKDYVALLVDPQDLAPGTYDLRLEVTSSAGSRAEVVTLRVS